MQSLLSVRRALDGHTTATLGNGEIALVLNGCKAGNNKKLLSPWTQDTGDDAEAEDDPEDEGMATTWGSVSSLYITKEQSSVTGRRQAGGAKPRGLASVSQLEMLHVITGPGCTMPERNWEMGFEGTNKGNVLGPMKLLKKEEDWQDTVRAKKKLYGKRRPPVGGTEDGKAAVEHRRRAGGRNVRWSPSVR